MKKKTGIAILTAILIIAITSSGFSVNADVTYKNASSWAVPELDKAAGYGFITDKIKGNMNAAITREEFAEIAVKLYEKYTGKQALYSDMSAFADTKNPEIFKAYDLKIVNGTDLRRKLFSPDLLISREQIAAMMLRSVKAIVPGADFSAAITEKLSDKKDISDWALESVGFMVKNGFLKGENGKIGPKDTCTREMAVIIASRVYEKYHYENFTGTGNMIESEPYDWNQIVINDTEIFRDSFLIYEKNDLYYIFIDTERFKYAFKLPDAGSNTYPEVDIIDRNISMIWRKGESTVLRVDMQEGSTEALIDGMKVDTGMAPYKEGGKMFIPINLFISAMKMDAETGSNKDVLYIQYKDAFPKDNLAGTWSDTKTDLFVDFEYITTGALPLSSYETAYRFNDDGTYGFRMVGVGGVNDTFIAQEGKYKIMGNTLMFYDIFETVYKGTPFMPVYNDKLLGRPQYSFIYNYDSRENRIEIGGFWYYRR